ncbi:hypothetical protein C0995_010117, partial [Termitomyces sp. Mi166
MQVAQNTQTEDQLIIASKAVHKTASKEDTFNDDFGESDLEFKQELIAMLNKTALKHANYELKNAAIHKKKKYKKNV